MECEQEKTPCLTLVYYDFRGFGQLIRSLLYYMKVPFDQILIKKGESFKTMKFNVDVSNVESLPFIIDGDKVIDNNNAIIFCICKKFGHESLLGQNIYERAKIKEIFGKYLQKYCLKMKVIYKFLEKFIENPNNVLQLKRETLINLRKISQNIDPLYQNALKRNGSKYLLGKITLLDFLFYESCFYITNCFADIEKEPCKIKNFFNSILGTDFGKEEQDLTQFISISREYKNFFQTQNFYIQNKQKLQSYGVSSPTFDQQMMQAYKKIWVGPKHFFH